MANRFLSDLDPTTAWAKAAVDGKLFTCGELVRHAAECHLRDIRHGERRDRATPQRTSDNMQWIVNAVRSRTNCAGKILIEGASFSSSRNWVSNGQAAAFDRLYGPAGNIAFSPHSYYDADASGTDASCVAGAQNRLDPPLSWAAVGDREIFIGEQAGSGLDAVCQFVLPAAYAKLRDHPNCIGWTRWGGARRRGSTYAYRLDPSNYQTGEDTPQMKLLLRFLAQNP
ncbi:cellulase family glycosylhydrolase [Novosphingobium sp. 9U]|uniref:cellulase family glycosylhydrolase n=1 Tax=Novosphingobium sp. 9U TaxID=2653158 RepID=UPI0012F1033A|nr:cellulase family glycosylhydrolase [Novosphingobium sp. 9U]VWX53300.1 hypothetical protein NOVOSPHI9U_440009 [Novosphingobium sp. 9U]